MELKDRIRKARKLKGYTQAEMTEKLGISLRAYHAYETKGVLPRTKERYDKLREILGISFEEDKKIVDIELEKILYTSRALMQCTAAMIESRNDAMLRSFYMDALERQADEITEYLSGLD